MCNVDTVCNDEGIVVSGVSKYIGTTRLIDNISFRVRRGSIFGLFGPNGSGKSTTLGMVSGLLHSSSGIIQVCGLDIKSNLPLVRMMTGILPTDLALVPHLRVWEHLRLVARVYGVSRQESEGRINAILKYFSIDNDADKFPGQLSFGTSKKLALAMTIINNQSVLILDEPFEGMDPASSRGISELLLRLSKNGVTVLLTSHSLGLIERIVDAYAIIVGGKIVFDSSWDDPRTMDPLEDVYFQFVQASALEELGWIN